MDLSAFQAADQAVKKIVKEYKPIADLSNSLDLAIRLMTDIGNLTDKKAELIATIAQLQQDLHEFEAKAAKARAAERRDYEDAAHNLSVVTNQTVELQAEARRAEIAIEGYKAEMGRVAKIFGKGF
jgi:uncharacterized protein YhaN